MKSHSMKPLPLASWADTKTTLHLYAQILGKVRLALHPPKNHWWHVTLYLTARGMTTGPIPYDGNIFQIDLDCLSHELIIATSTAKRASFDISSLSVKDFYYSLIATLKKFDIHVKINTHPFDPDKVGSDIPFDQDDKHITYDKEAVTTFWRILCVIYPIMQTFSGRFVGKTTPLHLFWHSLDYTVTFFSGKKAPEVSGMDKVSSGAYSHEEISFGFWAGDDNLPEPAFFSYTYPEPENIIEQPLSPSEAIWVDIGTAHLAVYKYSDWIQSDDLHASLLAFLESAYFAGATLRGWDDELFES